MFEDQPYFQVGFMCMAGRPKEDHRVEPCRYSEVRAGCYDIDARIKAMDIGGIHASVNFPSGVTGFGGKLFSESKDQELGFACTQAWNGWLFEGWHLPHKDRIVRACAETGTVLNLHVSASGFPKMPPGAPMLELGATLFGPMAVSAYAEWLWRPWPVKFPELKPEFKIAMSEAGIGWVAMLIDRVNNIMARSGYGDGWPDKKDSPSDVLRRNSWFCMIDDPSTISTRHTIGVENILFESDDPHGDGTWPDTPDVMKNVLGSLPDDETRMIAHENTAKLYRHPLPNQRLP